MRIGKGNKTADGLLVCSFKPVGLFPTTLEFRKLAERRSENSPTHEIFCEGFKVGAAWHKPAKGDRAAFLSATIHSPAFPGGSANLAVFPAKDDGRAGEYDLVWNERDAAPAPSGGGSGSGGTGQASDSQAGPDDDDIPF